MLEDNPDNEPKDLGKYEGERDEHRERHGHGKNTFPNKDVYVGDYLHGKRQGTGKYFYKAAADKIAKYDGEFVDFKKCGQGTMYYPDGAIYKGMFAEGKRHGQGVYTYPNGDTYSGAWVNGMKHGPGTYNFKDTRCVYVGVWKQNQIVRGVFKHPDGTTSYRGQFERQRPNNEGVYVFKHNAQAGRFTETVKKTEIEIPRPPKPEGDPAESTGADPSEQEPIKKTIYPIQTRQWTPLRLFPADQHTQEIDPHLLEAAPGELDIVVPPPPPPPVDPDAADPAAPTPDDA